MENFKVRFLNYENDDFIIGKVYNVENGTIVDEKYYPFTSWSENGNTFENLKEWFEESYDDSCKVELVTDEIKQQFTKSDLKDGMVVTYKNGSIRLLYLGRLYEIDEHINLTTLSNINDYNEFLLNAHNKNLDIVKVEYMGKTIWQRKQKEYMTLEEASKTGKGYKHKDCATYYYYPQNALTHAIGVTRKDMFDLLKVKEFEIEQS